MMPIPPPLTRAELYERVWNQPVRTTAKEYGLTDVGLKKLCTRHDIPTPGLGYWTRVKSGKQGRKVPLPPERIKSRRPVLVYHTADRPSARADLGVAELWAERERQPENHILVHAAGEWQHPFTLATEKILKKTTPNEGGWLVAPPGCLALRVSAAQLPRALSIIDTLLVACEARGWPATTAFVMPRRKSNLGTFWYPGAGWVYHLPEKRAAMTGVGILRNQVWFSLREMSRITPPTDAEIRAHHRKFRWGGDPPPRPRPTGELLLEIDLYPSYSSRYRFRDHARGGIENQLDDVVVAFVRTALALQAHQLDQAKVLRRNRQAMRRRAETERQDEALRQDIEHLRRGIVRWRWREQALAFLAVAREQAAARGVTSPEFQQWLARSESFVEERGFDRFFARWRAQPEE